MKKSRQVKRLEQRTLRKKGRIESTHELYYIPLFRFSRAGVQYMYYQKIVDIKGLRK